MELTGVEGVMGFFDVFFRPDLEEQSEKSEIIDAANLLQIGEFQLLQLAYKQWYGEELPAEGVDTLFSAYMLRQHVPVWARHYARSVLQQHSYGRIDINDPSYHRYDRDYVTHVPQGVRRFCLASLWCGLVIFGGVALAALVSQDGVSLLPPYFDRSEVAPPTGVNPDAD